MADAAQVRSSHLLCTFEVEPDAGTQHLSLSVVNNDGLPGPPFSMQQPLSQTTLQDGDTMMLLRGSVISV
jgi:hypothetical protein